MPETNTESGLLDTYFPEASVPTPRDNYKTEEGWYVGDHTISEATIARFHALALQYKSDAAYMLSDLTGYKGPEGPYPIAPPGMVMDLPSHLAVRRPRRRPPHDKELMERNLKPVSS